MKRTPLNRKTPLQGAGQLRRAPIRQVSKKRQTQIPRRQAVCQEVRTRDVTCRFWHHVHDLLFTTGQHVDGYPDECTSSLEVHEIIPRSAWAAGWLVPSNCVLLCGGPGGHHAWVTDNPSAAHLLGLHGFSHERPDYRKENP